MTINPAGNVPNSGIEYEFQQATNTYSVSGTGCQVVGSIGAVVGGLLVVASFATGNAYAVIASGGIGLAGALAGAPIAALGSIATSSKRGTKLKELEMKMQIDRQ